MSFPDISLIAAEDPVIHALAVETAISLAHGHRILEMAGASPTRQVPVTLTAAEGVLIGIGSTVLIQPTLHFFFGKFLAEMAENFSLDLRRIKKNTFFPSVTRDVKSRLY